MRRNPRKAELFDDYRTKALESDDQAWDKLKENIWSQLQSFFRPGLRRDITYTLKVFLGTARWYNAHGIEQFTQYTDLVNCAVLTKLDLDPVFLIDISRPIDVWAGRQLTQVQHLIIASVKYEKTFDVPIWGSRKSEIRDGAKGRFSGHVFENPIPRFAVRNWKTFLPLNRAYESHSCTLTGSAELNDLLFLQYRISDFLRILRSARFEFLVKDPDSVKLPGLCMYAVLSGITVEDTQSSLPLEGSTFIRIRLSDSSGEEVSFYLSSDDYSDLASISGQKSLQGSRVAVLVKCRLGKGLFRNSPEVVPIRVWLIDESRYASNQLIATLRIRLTAPCTDSQFATALHDGHATLAKNRFQYKPVQGDVDDLLKANPLFKKVADGALFEELTEDLRQVAKQLQQPILPSTTEPETLLSLELVLRALYPSEVTEDRIAYWASEIVSDWSLENPTARRVVLHTYLQRLSSAKDIIRCVDARWRMTKCMEVNKSALSDDWLNKYLVLLVSISPNIRKDTLLAKAIGSLGLNKNYNARFEDLIAKLVLDGRLIPLGKHSLRLPGKLPDDIYTEDRNEEIDRLFMNILRERISTYESNEELHKILLSKIPDLTQQELDDLIQQHLDAGDIVVDFDQLYAIRISPEDSIQRRERYSKKHFPTPIPAANPDQIRTNIMQILHATAPNRLSFAVVCSQVTASVRGSKYDDVSKALRELCRTQLVLVDKHGRYVENPTPANLNKREQVETKQRKFESPIILRENEVSLLSTLARAHQTGIIYVNGRRRGLHKVFVKTFQESETTLSNLLKQVSNGDVIELKFEDHLGSHVRVWSERGVLTASYEGSQFAMHRIFDALGR